MQSYYVPSRLLFASTLSTSTCFLANDSGVSRVNDLDYLASREKGSILSTLLLGWHKNNIIIATTTTRTKIKKVILLLRDNSDSPLGCWRSVWAIFYRPWSY
ncbi:hypothetical protein F4801DRAFT_284142 [Xylaria longipes]|nr:hypothetical protein F4801DRAFT_284142 [Xylaria longipes]